LRGFDAELVDATALLARYPAVIRNGWALKPYAAVHSRFAEVLSLDADALPLVSPDCVYDWPDYREHGALFWPDQVDLAAENPVWAALGLPARRVVSFETGQFVLDKRRCWAALAATIALNNESERLYRMIYGEKDSFLLAFLLAGQPCNVIAHRPLLFDADLIQRDPAGAPFIHHRTLSKYVLSGPNRPVFGDTLTAAMEAALLELRADWTGIVFHPPAMSAAAREMAAAMAGRRWVYQTSGAGQRLMVLDADFQVGAGRAEYEQHWAVVERDGGMVLQLFSATRLAIELHPGRDGSWSGATTATLGFSARLVPEDAAATMPLVNASAAGFVEVLLAAAGIGGGFDAGEARQLEAALGLLNRTHADVPETLRNWLAGNNIAAAWRVALQDCAGRLAAQRDARLRDLAPLPAPLDGLRAGFYDRIA
jgi:hypothetical protein